ncbi:MAG: hypothetical protein ACO1RX_11420 [Candidatus Sericytochromatia bacterium]
MELRFPRGIPPIPEQVRTLADATGLSSVLPEIPALPDLSYSVERRSEATVSTSGIVLSAGGEAAQRPGPVTTPSAVDFPDKASPAAESPTAPPTSPNSGAAAVAGASAMSDELLGQLIALKGRLSADNLNPDTQRQLEQELVQLARQLKDNGTLGHGNVARQGERAWTDAHSLDMIPQIAETLESLRRYDDQISFFNLEAIVNGVAAQTAKTEGPEAGRARGLQALREIRIAASQGREALQSTLARWAEEAGTPFTPSLEGPERYNPFADSTRLAADARADAVRPASPENAESRAFQQDNAPQLAQVMGRLNQRGFTPNLVTPSALSDIFARQAKIHGKEYAEESLALVVEASQQDDPEVLERVLVAMARDSEYVFHPGASEEDPRRYDPFANRRDIYSDEGERTTLVSAGNSRLRIGFSFREGIVFDIGGNRTTVRAPRWFISLMASYQDNPEQLAGLLARSDAMLTRYNGRPVNLSSLVAAVQQPTPAQPAAPSN